jgi:hypothetical protein
VTTQLYIPIVPTDFNKPHPRLRIPLFGEHVRLLTVYPAAPINCSLANHDRHRISCIRIFQCNCLLLTFTSGYTPALGIPTRGLGRTYLLQLTPLAGFTASRG